MFRRVESQSPIPRASYSRSSRPTPAGSAAASPQPSATIGRRGWRNPRLAPRQPRCGRRGCPGIVRQFRSPGAWLDRQSPWRLPGHRTAAGALSAAALPPVYALPVLILSFSGLVLLVDRTPRPLAAIALGWFFAWGYFVAGIYWVANALLSVSSAFGWLLPLRLSGPSAGSRRCSLPSRARRRAGARMLWPAGPARVLVLAVCWTLFEWLRGWVLTGFPWNPRRHLLGIFRRDEPICRIGRRPGSEPCHQSSPPPCRHCLWIEWPPIGRGRDGARHAIHAVVRIAGGLALLLAIWIGGSILAFRCQCRHGARRSAATRASQCCADGESFGQPWCRGPRSASAPDWETPGYDKITDVIWSETAEPCSLELLPGWRAWPLAASRAGARPADHGRAAHGLAER